MKQQHNSNINLKHINKKNKQSTLSIWQNNLSECLDFKCSDNKNKQLEQVISGTKHIQWFKNLKNELKLELKSIME